MAFSSKSANPNPLLRIVRQRPFALFGLPFLGLVVFSSFALSTFTQTRYDLNDSKTKSVSKEEELGMSKDRKKVDIREEYYVSVPNDSLRVSARCLEVEAGEWPTFSMDIPRFTV